MVKMIFNVAASESGALSILHEHYEIAKLDLNNKYIFVISTPKLNKEDNIDVLRYPWVKKSPIHRLYFDYLIAPKLVKINQPDDLISLQNTRIPRISSKQIIYLHNFLPFTQLKFSFFNEFRLWYQKNIVGKIIKNSLSNNNFYIVQSYWFKKFLYKNTILDNQNIFVDKPKLDYLKISFNKKKYDLQLKEPTFFYPAGPFSYKNHQSIIELAKKIKHQNLQAKFLFTLIGDENRYSKKLFKFVKKHKLPVEFIGYLNQDDLFETYSKSILLFASSIETFGLPLYEAKLIKATILAPKFEYIEEALNDYSNKIYYDFTNSDDLYKKTKFILNHLNDIKQ